MDSINLLGICGSPRKNGNSHFLLEIALEAAEATVPGLVKTELYSISGKTFNPCDACNQCHDKLGHCRQTDDDFGELRDKWHAADAIIYSVPIYHMGIPGQLKVFIDRLGNSDVEGFYSRSLKVIGCIVQGTGFATGQEQVMIFLNGHATMMSCIPVGGVYPGGYLGAGGWTREKTEKHALRDLHAEQEQDVLFTADSAKELSKHIVNLSLIIKAGGKHYQKMLKKDGGYDVFLRRLDSE